jgi:hypothetical protein
VRYVGRLALLLRRVESPTCVYEVKSKGALVPKCPHDHQPIEGETRVVVPQFERCELGPYLDLRRALGTSRLRCSTRAWTLWAGDRSCGLVNPPPNIFSFPPFSLLGHSVRSRHHLFWEAALRADIAPLVVALEGRDKT